MRDYLCYEPIKEKYCDYEILFNFSDDKSNLTYIITTFNRFELLKRCVNSIITQNVNENITILISDNDIKTIKDYNENREKYKFFEDKPIVYVVNKKNIGGGANCNQAVFLSNTKYVCVIHDDDIIHPMHFNYFKKAICDNPSAVYISFSSNTIDLRKSNNDDMFLKKKINDKVKIKNIKMKKLYNNYYCPMLGAIISKEAFLNVGGLGNYCNMEDYIFTYKICDKYNGLFWNLKLYGYTIFENDSLNADIWNDILIEKYYLRKHIKNKNKFFSISNFIYLCRDISYFESHNQLKKMILDKKYISEKTNQKYYFLMIFTMLFKVLRLIKRG